MANYKNHLFSAGENILEAMNQLNILAEDAILFITDDNNRLLGSLTDGDVRRGFLKGLNVEDNVENFIQKNPRFIEKGNYNLKEIIFLRENNFKIVPVINGDKEVVNIINFRIQRSFLPVDTVIMAGGRGERLRPITDNTPKALIEICGKPIIEHQIDHLSYYGINTFWISVNYLGERIESYFRTGKKLNVEINYLREDEPSGTIGAVSKMENIQHDYVLIINSDILTNLDFESFYIDFLSRDADFSVVTVPYHISIPFAVLETTNNHILSLKEKPDFTYYSSGGIYLMKKEIVKKIPGETFYNATDLIQDLIKRGNKVISYPMNQYWLDIGKPEDLDKANNDLKYLNFS